MPHAESPSPAEISPSSLTITGLASAWPEATLRPEDLQKFADGLYDTEAPWYVRKPSVDPPIKRLIGPQVSKASQGQLAKWHRHPLGPAHLE